MSDRTGSASGNGREAKHEAPSPVLGGREQMRQTGSETANQIKAVARDAQAEGASLAGEAKRRVTDQVEAGKQGAADRLEDVAQALHRSSEQLEGHQDWLAGMVEKGAGELSALADTLRTNDLRSMVGAVEDFGKRQPALFLGASIALGFALVRLGRAAAADASRDDLPQMPEVFHGR